jgi:hypothetical protein
MRSTRLAATLIALCIVLLAVSAVADHNQYGVANSYKVNFIEKVLVGGQLLPAGDYQIRHTMEGQDHVMVFEQLGVKNPIQVKAKCTLVPLNAKATDTQKTYKLNDANVRVLSELTFRGDTAKHVF